MAGKKESSAPWRQTSVLIRADIFEQAREQKIDINDECNRALAERVGIDYRQQKIPAGRVPEPVMIAPNEAPAQPKRMPAIQDSPAMGIINADDPHAPKAAKIRQPPKQKPVRAVPVAPAPAPVPVPVPEKITVAERASPMADKTKNPALPRKKKDDSAKKFFAAMILREDAENAVVSKDDMYYAFERWSRDHRVVCPVPDKRSFAITLKNQFAVKEKMVEGTPSWIGVRVTG